VTSSSYGGRRITSTIALAAMVMVTSWSVWASAQPRHTQPRPAAVEHPGAAEPESEEPKPFNWFEFGRETPPYVAMLVNFGILAAGYYLLGRKPIAAALQNRSDSIAKEIEDAQKMKREAEERAKMYQAKLETLEEEVRMARGAFVRAGEAESERILADANAKAERMRRDAEFLVEQELKQIRKDLWRDAIDTAVAAAEELLKKHVTASDHERLAEDYLAELGAPPKTRPAAVPPPSPFEGAGRPS
jgi:F0F1-type ATP synthase membrane subunit b/b'